MNYAGEIFSDKAFEILKSEKNSFLVDVRTLPEWTFSGYPDLSYIGKDTKRISWKIYPNMNLNQNFLQQIENEILDKNSQIFFMCKTGGRSLDAAIFATEIGGYKNCFNITNGFEGDANENNQRGKINGWKALNLPWLQA